MLRAQLQEKKMATRVQGVWRRLKARRRVTQLVRARDYFTQSDTALGEILFGLARQCNCGYIPPLLLHHHISSAEGVV